ncbi:hypothetical protein CW304_27970 [Bacillus sp. UFRGS-B20]|nr:hypothetical protein CW304_27970 [Bacillus sp. UFRGS-B20]
MNRFSCSLRSVFSHYVIPLTFYLITASCLPKITLPHGYYVKIPGKRWRFAPLALTGHIFTPRLFCNFQ